MIEELGHNLPKCGNSDFSDMVKSSILPNLEILGSPIGDFIYSSRFFAEKCNLFRALLRALTDVSAVDLRIGFSLIRMCRGYCKFVHLARTTPTCTSLCSDSLKLFGEKVRLCIAYCLAVDVPDTQWQKAQLCPKLHVGGLGLRSLSLHSCAAFIFSLAASELGSPDNIHLQQAVSHFNAQVSPQDSLTVEAVLNTPPQQKALSLKHDTHMFQALVSSASPANKTRMLSVSAPHASSWVSAIPSVGLNMHLHVDAEECQVAITWWLGLNTSTASSCPFCPEALLDPLGGDVVTRHNHLRDTFA